jgi:hypothetical protein
MFAVDWGNYHTEACWTKDSFSTSEPPYFSTKTIQSIILKKKFSDGGIDELLYPLLMGVYSVMSTGISRSIPSYVRENILY